MIKRINKATSLLVAAAAISSIMPATGVHAYERLQTKDGAMYNVVAFKDGKAIIDGNIKDGETDAVYFLNNGKLTELEGIDTGSTFKLYGDNYVEVNSGDCYIDLETGKIIEEDLEADNLDDASVALRKAIRNVAKDRYTDHTQLKNDLKAIEGNKFGETWYKTSYNTKTTEVAVYTDVKGNYIDADYSVGTVKVEVKVGDKQKNVTLNNTEDKEDYNTSIAISDAEVIAQDSKYFYRTATLTIKSENVITEVNGLAITDKDVFTVSEDGTTVSFNVIQKISKAQASEDVDGAKYAQSVTNYVIADENGKAINKDGEAITLESLSDYKFTVVGSKLVGYNYNEDAQTVVAQTIEFDTNNIKVNKKDDLKDIFTFEVDAEGNLWALAKGAIYKFNNDEEWEIVYKVDGAMKHLSVYNAKNLVVWNKENEIYSIVGGKVVSDEEEVKTGWVQNADGNWSFIKADGTKATGWLNDNGTWYYLDSTGNMTTGWLNDRGTWYYLNPVSNGYKGAMQTGWIKDGSTWYYLESNGAMKTGWLNDRGTWYYLNPVSDGTRGAMKTGWIKDGNDWYYLKSNGAMAYNTTVDGYKLGANGAWIR